jgi:hypothetical protein
MKSKSSTKPIYSAQIEGGAKSLTNAYDMNAPHIQAATDATQSLIPGLTDRAMNGDPSINLSRGYVKDTLGTDSVNPQLDGMVAQTNDDIQNRMGAKLAKMGLGPAGSSYSGVVGRELGKNELGMRYSAWNDLQQRKQAAAAMSPGLAAGDAVGVNNLVSVAGAADDPVQAAAGYASGLGGLLGQYTKTKQKGSLGAALLQAASNAAAAYAGGG